MIWRYAISRRSHLQIWSHLELLILQQTACSVSAGAFMDSHRVTTTSSYFLWILLSSVSLNTLQSMAADALSPGQSLSGNQTIVSKGGKFELGFFTPGPGTSHTHNYYIGIWYKKVSKQTVIWVANRGVPISDPSTSELKISGDGNLVLLNPTQIWSTNLISPSSHSRVAILLDTGNLVLADRLNTSTIAWQSFDHPTDTMVPDAWFGMNKITGEYQTLTSWRSAEDPAPGPFSVSMDPSGSIELVMRWNESVTYFRSGNWTGHMFDSVPELSANSRNIYNITFIENKEKRYFTYTLYDKNVITRTVMDRSGLLKQFTWLGNDWILVLPVPKTQCRVFSVCGSFGVCDEKSTPPCRCLQGFEPTSAVEYRNLSDWSNGCKRRSTLQCYSNGSIMAGEEDQFRGMPNVKLPAKPQQLEAGSAKDCELACLGNCSCTAYSYENGCSIWNGDLRDLEQLSDVDTIARTLHLRLAAFELSTPPRKTRTTTKIVIVVIVCAIVSLLIAIGVVTWVCSRWGSAVEIKKLDEGSVVVFKYSDLQHVTKNFTHKLGSGGFGSVFKGVFPDSTAIAVKKLEGIANLPHGEKQFRTEVSTLGMVQHVNLVRLRGFCIEASKKLLVYDYMPKGSLDAHLFGGDSKDLPWKIRYQIILGVARGLAYLHDKCRQCIIHCDIKPENILLDADFCPKVADFGMAKLVGRDFSRVLTTMRGTRGYLAPEWISGLPITPKADVYSYGMMLLEVVSGKRNTQQSQVGNVGFYPAWAAMRVNEGDTLSLLDHNLEGEADVVELDRACRVACWCIQDCEAHRPSMGQVVQILEGFSEVTMPPIPRSLQLLMEEPQSIVLFSQLEADKV